MSMAGSPARLTARHLAVGLGILSALALAPTAQAATTSLDGTVHGGSLSNTAPTIANLNATPSGLTQTADKFNRRGVRVFARHLDVSGHSVSVVRVSALEYKLSGGHDLTDLEPR